MRGEMEAKRIDLDRLSPSMNRIRHALVCRYNQHPDARAVMAGLDPSLPLHVTWCGFLAEHDGYEEEEAVYRRRVLEDCVTVAANGCMLSMRALDHSGYAGLEFLGRWHNNAARLVCAAEHGPIVRQMVVRHSEACQGCRNCINPAHLQPGSQADNIRDGCDRTNRYVNPNGRRTAEIMRVRRWVRKARAAGVADVLQLPKAHRLPAPIIAKVNAKLMA